MLTSSIEAMAATAQAVLDTDKGVLTPNMAEALNDFYHTHNVDAPTDPDQFYHQGVTRAFAFLTV